MHVSFVIGIMLDGRNLTLSIQLDNLQVKKMDTLLVAVAAVAVVVAVADTVAFEVLCLRRMCLEKMLM